MASKTADLRHTEHRKLWQSKPVLGEVYGHLYRKIADACTSGVSVEVGGGSGNLKHFLPDVFSFDIVTQPWLDFMADAQRLPLRDGAVGNLILVDVLHHIEFPLLFLREAQRVLRPGGRLIMLEPGITPLSYPVYKFLHEEPVELDAHALLEGSPDPDKDPYMGNQALPTLLVTRDAHRLKQALPDLRIRRIDWLSLWAYPLSGGFKSWSAITPAMARYLLRAEDLISPLVGRALGFRIMIVLERAAKSSPDNGPSRANTVGSLAA